MGRCRGRSDHARRVRRREGAALRLAIATCLWRRHPLAISTLARWAAIRTAGVEIEIVVAGSENDASRAIARDVGAHYVETPNKPLSAKWNAAFRLAREIKPDLVMLLGSDDWITAEAAGELARAGLRTGYAGIAEMYMFDLRTGRACHWEGYRGRRFNDTLGAGRTLRADVLDQVGWQLFDRSLDRALDYEMTTRLRLRKIAEPIVAASKCLLDVKGGGPNICRFDQIQPQTRIDPSELDRVFGEGSVAELHRIRALSSDAGR